MRRLRVHAAEPADRERIVRTLTASWGGTTVVAHGVVYDAAALPALIAERDGAPVERDGVPAGRVGGYAELAGLLTYDISDRGLEVVTIDAPVRHGGVGSALLEAAVARARAAGAGRLWLVTTNDNLDALRFYQRRGMRIVGVTPGAVDAARTLKPSIPPVGAYGIPLHDELTLELRL
jgi:GNAT superfamily N-acetyltransferase